MAFYWVALDAGHSKATPGKRNEAQNFYEWEFNMDMCNRLKPLLEASGIQVFVVNTNPTGADMSLTTRYTRTNNEFKRLGRPANNLFVSLHSNAFSDASARGFEIYTSKGCSSASTKASKEIHDEIIACQRKIDPNMKDRGCKTENFSVIRNTITRSVLIEYAFYSNLSDLKLLKNNRQDMAIATAKGICNFFGISFKGSTSTSGGNTQTPATSDKKYSNGIYNDYFIVKSPDGKLTVRDARPSGDTLGKELGVLKTGDKIFGGYCLNNWMGVDFNGKQGFVSATYLEEAPDDVETKLPSLKAPFANGTYGGVKARCLHEIPLRKGRPGNANYDTVVKRIPKGTELVLNYCLNGWFSTETFGGTLFVDGDCLELILDNK